MYQLWPSSSHVMVVFTLHISSLSIISPILQMEIEVSSSKVSEFLLLTNKGWAQDVDIGHLTPVLMTRPPNDPSCTACISFFIVSEIFLHALLSLSHISQILMGRECDRSRS